MPIQGASGIATFSLREIFFLNGKGKKQRKRSRYAHVLSV